MSKLVSCLSREIATREPQWRTILRSAPEFEFLLFGKWHEKTKIYRWRWLASIAARRHVSRGAMGVLTSAVVEPYWPGTNVVSLCRSRVSGVRETRLGVIWRGAK